MLTFGTGFQKTMLHCLDDEVVKAPRFKCREPRGLDSSSQASDYFTSFHGFQVAALPAVRHARVGGRTGWPGVCLHTV